VIRWHYTNKIATKMNCFSSDFTSCGPLHCPSLLWYVVDRCIISTRIHTCTVFVIRLSTVDRCIVSTRIHTCTHVYCFCNSIVHCRPMYSIHTYTHVYTRVLCLQFNCPHVYTRVICNIDAWQTPQIGCCVCSLTRSTNSNPRHVSFRL
jgi:hypothetical protein